MIRRPPRSTLSSSSAASDVYKRQSLLRSIAEQMFDEDEVASQASMQWIQQQRNLREAEGRPVGRMIVLLESMEGIPAQVLQDFVSLCIENFVLLPISLVLGVCSSCEAVHRSLNHGVTARLMLREFELPLASEALPALHRLLWHPDLGGSMLSGEVLGFLLQRFLWSTQSLEGWAHGVHVCLTHLEHSQRTRGLDGATLLATDASQEVLGVVKTQQEDQLQGLVGLAGVRGQRGGHGERVTLEEVAEMAKGWRQLQGALQGFCCLIQSVFEQRVDPHQSGPLSMVWSLGADQTQLAAQGFKAAVSAVGGFDHVKLEALTAEWEVLLEPCGSCPVRMIQAARARLAELRSLMDKEDEERQARREGAVVGAVEVRKEWSLAKKRKFKLGQHIHPTASSSVSSHSMVLLDSVRAQLPKDLLAVAHTLWDRVQSAGLVELFLYNDVDALAQMLQPNLPKLASEALLSPHKFLGIELNGPPDSRWPDTCVLFAVYQDMGRRINLQDWFERFFQVAQTAEPQSDEYLQSRFVRGVAELELLGIVTASKRGTMEKLFIKAM
eukprot:TRINITY_DN49581_c0_g1_i2.p1 TRINITY_DN49581_c0_g1~~TRINITY_DN49581_c0_g1_i2.p1  ORF type:complete len:555 (-),score=153.89 TRINITY_DN49581_c0_g1_i2:243-1907(-)